jgi:Flp pilus assembly protein TadG
VTLKLIRNDTRGSALIEFTVTFPLFLLLMFGLGQAGLLLFTYTGLQHGVERAARCASVNYSVIELNIQNPIANAITESCFGSAVAPGSVNAGTIRQYAAQSSWGIVPSSGSFTVGCPNSRTTGCDNNSATCGTTPAGTPIPGYAVSVSPRINLISYIFSTRLTATSCFPINVS